MPIPISSCLSPTEGRNAASNCLSDMDTLSSVQLMVEEEASALQSIAMRHTKKLALLVDLVAGSLRSGGRLIYVGAGSSGRLAKMDSVEVISTFGTSPDLVSALLAGGKAAATRPKDEAEDTYECGADAMRRRGPSVADVVLGITASGQTAFVWGALQVAKEAGSTVALLTFNPYLQLSPSEFPCPPDLVIAMDLGPEVLTGSTRLKCGTATKCVLDLLSTISMVRLNRTRDNLMVYAKGANDKLRERAVRAFRSLHPGLSEEAARSLLAETNYDLVAADSRLLSFDE